MKAKKDGGFILCLLFNMLISIAWLIPAVILLVLHFVLDISIWWMVGAIGIWLIGVILWTSFISFANKCGNIKDPPKENKNPYSATNDQYLKKD